MSEHALELNENQVLYLFSTTSQVLAAIYGLTLTGFIFFRNELSRDELEDETLAEAIDSLRMRYFVLLIFITAMVISTLLLSNLVMSNELAGKTLANTALVNLTQSAFFTSLVAIAYFIFDVIAPGRIRTASTNLKDQLDPATSTDEKGSLEEFLRNYNRIEQLLVDVGNFYNQQPVAYVSSSPSAGRRISNSRLAEILLKNDRISQSLFARLKELITLRNSIIHGEDPTVSRKMELMSREVYHELNQVLDRPINYAE